MTGKFTVEIISPERIILKNEADEVVIPSFEGEMGILKDHLPLITFLRPGLIKIKEDDLTKVFFIEEGTIEFSENKLLILTSSAKETSKMIEKLKIPIFLYKTYPLEFAVLRKEETCTLLLQLVTL